MKNSSILLLVTLGIIVVFWTVLFVKVAASSLPYNPISLSKKSRTNLAVLIPQGWAFFTRDPREATVVIYRVHQNELELAIPPNASGINLFGALRTTRAMGIEMGALSTQIKEEQWQSCEQSIKHCFRQNEVAAVPVINKAYRPTFCGEYYLTMEEPVPWAWSGSFSQIEMPCKFVKINALCL